MKYFKKRYLQILNKLLIALLIILLLVLIFGFVGDLLDKIEFLIKHSTQQANEIHNLTQHVNSLEVANAKLHNVVQYQHEQLSELRVHNNTMSFTMQPKEVTMEDLHNEIEPQLHKSEFFNGSTIAATILGAMAIIRGTVGIFVPGFN